MTSPTADLPSPGERPRSGTGAAGAPAAGVSRRRLLRDAAVGTVITVLGGAYVLADGAKANDEKRSDGRRRLPPGQRLLTALKPMGGQPGSPLRKDFRLSVSGAVERPFSVSFDELLSLGSEAQQLDVHCVTGWTVLGARFDGVRMAKLIAKAQPSAKARYAIFEAAHGYTANVPLSEAMKPSAMVAFSLEGRPLKREHGAPVRGVVPDLYFWKSAKWLTGIRLVERDVPGYWERRGYHNHGDPWREERYG